MSVRVYAIAPRSSADIIGRTGKPRLRRVRVGRVDAIVGHVGRPPRTTRDAIRRYDRLVNSLWRRSPSLLPVRFGTIVPDAAELTRILDARQTTLIRQLSLVRNRAQMTVRIVTSANLPASGRRKRPRSGSEYLRERAGAARLAAEAPELVPLRRAVERWIRAERVERHLQVATLYHLVPRGAAERYASAIAQAASDTGSGVLISGPCPPYAFAEAW